MIVKSIYRLAIIAVMMLSSANLSACGAKNEPPTAPTPEGLFEIDPLFREYYRDMGGEARLGPAISLRLDQDGSQCQFTTNALMCYNPLATDKNRFYLADIGNKLNLHDKPEATKPAPGARVVNGFTIYPDFVTLYDLLDKNQLIGNPISQVRYNYDQQRVEQYFEKAGLYHQFDEQPGVAHLLPYGAYVCAEGCLYDKSLPPKFIPIKSEIDTPFAAGLERMGGLTIFGRPLSQPYQAKDGNLEQVYENVVLFAPANNPAAVKLRPIALLLGMSTTPPGPKIFDIQQNMVFYPIKGVLGYHVPVAFDQFIARHGGISVSGQPVSEAMLYQGNPNPRQCFENYCLDYNVQAPESSKVTLTPLGARFLNKLSPQLAELSPYSPDNILIEISEASPQITSKDAQMISAVIMQKKELQPIPNMEASLELNLPDGNSQTYKMPPTGADGRTSQIIPPLISLPNGSLIAYRVCLNIPTENALCMRDSYLIWNPK
jgi:hypothetical protein